MSAAARVEARLAPPHLGADALSDLVGTRKLHIPFESLSALCGTSDGCLIVVASLLGGSAYQLTSNGSFGQFNQFIGAGVLAAVLYVFSARANGFYQPSSIFSPGKSRRRIFRNWMLVTLFLSLMAFLFKVGAEFSRGSVICFATLALVLLLLGRSGIRRLITIAMAHGRVEGRRVVIIGTRDEFATLDSSLLLQNHGLTEVARAEFPLRRGGNGFALSHASESALADALELARQRRASEIVLAMPWHESRQIELIREALRASPLPVQLLPDRKIRNFVLNPAFAVKSSLAVEVQRAPLTSLEQLFKRSLDVFGAIAGLILFAPIMFVAAIAVTLTSPGPVLFKQRRNGFNARQFVIYKFRTMKVMEDGGTIRQARKIDPRITTVGRLLRQSSIDELPQLVNVLKGDMSLVGPRPHALAHDDQYGQLLAEYAFRHHVKPGITGWAQVNGYRGETPRVEHMKRRIEFDLWYINNWSLLLDFKIIARTCLELVRRRNAY